MAGVRLLAIFFGVLFVVATLQQPPHQFYDNLLALFGAAMIALGAYTDDRSPAHP